MGCFLPHTIRVRATFNEYQFYVLKKLSSSVDEIDIDAARTLNTQAD